MVTRSLWKPFFQEVIFAIITVIKTANFWLKQYFFHRTICFSTFTCFCEIVIAYINYWLLFVSQELRQYNTETVTSWSNIPPTCIWEVPLSGKTYGLASCYDIWPWLHLLSHCMNLQLYKMSYFNIIDVLVPFKRFITSKIYHFTIIPILPPFQHFTVLEYVI